MEITEDIKRSAQAALEQLRKEHGDEAADSFLEAHGGMEGLYKYCAKVTSVFNGIHQTIDDEAEEFITENYGSVEQRSMCEGFLTFDDIKKAYIAGKGDVTSAPREKLSKALDQLRSLLTDDDPCF